MRTPTLLRMTGVAAAMVGAALAAAKPPAEGEGVPVVQRFNLPDPIPQGSGGGGPQRSTVLSRSIDVSQIPSVTLQGQIDPNSPPANAVVESLFPPGTTILGYAYDANFAYFGNPANPAMGFRLFNGGDQYVVNIAPPTSPAQVTLAPQLLLPNEQFTLPDGKLRVEFFEAVDDLGGIQPDGVWQSGTVSVLYSLDSVTECCIWDNGAFDNRDGALSQDSPARPEPVYHVMADDFYLEPGYVHMVDYMEAVFMVLFPAPGYNFAAPIGRLEIRTDCDGKPGELVETFDAWLMRDSLIGEMTIDLGTVHAYRVVALTDGLCLKGGKPYWASFVLTGVANQGGTDLWYWGTTGSPSVVPPYDPPLHVKGSLPHRQAFPGGPWERIDCASGDPNCLGCTDLNFCIRGERCRIVHDAGTYKTPPQPIGQVIGQYGARSVDLAGLINNQARAADDVTISPCETSLLPCVVEAYIWTTCTPPTARLEIYETRCDEDTVLPAEDPLPYVISAGEEDAVYQGLEIPAPFGPPFRLYCFKFKDFGGFVFQPGRTYWFAAIGTGGNNLTNDAYFAFSAPKCPDDECYRLGNEGHAKSAFANSMYPDWTPTSLVPGLLMANDFAMLVAVRNGPVGVTGGPEVCRADFDRSGQVTVSDIFSFLSEWFSGCP